MNAITGLAPMVFIIILVLAALAILLRLLKPGDREIEVKQVNATPIPFEDGTFMESFVQPIYEDGLDHLETAVDSVRYGLDIFDNGAWVEAAEEFISAARSTDQASRKFREVLAMVENPDTPQIRNARARLTEGKRLRQWAKDMEAACDARLMDSQADAERFVEAAKNLRRLVETWTKESPSTFIAEQYPDVAAPVSIAKDVDHYINNIESTGRKVKNNRRNRVKKESVKYASLLPRLIAFIIDSIIQSVFMFILLLIFFPNNYHFYSGSPVLLCYIIAFVFLWLYNAGFESSTFMATPGKMLLGIKVKTTRNEKMSFLLATWRTLVKGILVSSFLIGIIDCIVIMFTTKNQSIQDICAGTIVIYSSSDEDENDDLLLSSDQGDF